MRFRGCIDPYSEDLFYYKDAAGHQSPEQACSRILSDEGIACSSYFQDDLQPCGEIAWQEEEDHAKKYLPSHDFSKCVEISGDKIQHKMTRKECEESLRRIHECIEDKKIVCQDMEKYCDTYCSTECRDDKTNPYPNPAFCFSICHKKCMRDKESCMNNIVSRCRAASCDLPICSSICDSPHKSVRTAMRNAYVPLLKRNDGNYVCATDTDQFCLDFNTGTNDWYYKSNPIIERYDTTTTISPPTTTITPTMMTTTSTASPLSTTTASPLSMTSSSAPSPIYSPTPAADLYPDNTPAPKPNPDRHRPLPVIETSRAVIPKRPTIAPIVQETITVHPVMTTRGVEPSTTSMIPILPSTSIAPKGLSKKLLIIIIVVASVLSLVVIGAIIYFLFFSSTPPPPPTQSQQVPLQQYPPPPALSLQPMPMPAPVSIPPIQQQYLSPPTQPVQVVTPPPKLQHQQKTSQKLQQQQSRRPLQKQQQSMRHQQQQVLQKIQQVKTWPPISPEAPYSDVAKRVKEIMADISNIIINPYKFSNK